MRLFFVTSAKPATLLESLAFMIKRLLQRRDVIYNTTHVFLNKGLNAVVPVLLIPYFNKVFGVEGYGILIYIQSLMMLLMFVTEYGFHVTGTRDISIHQHDKKYVSETVSSIIVVKLLLAVACYCLLFFYLYVKGSGWELSLLYLLTYTSFLLQSFTPFWFFQGIKSNWIITTVNLANKVLFLLLVFSFVKEGSSLLSVPATEAVSYGLSFVLSMVIIFFIIKIDFSWPSWKLIRHQLERGSHIFLFSIFNWLVTGGAVVAVEKYLGSTELGYFATFSRLMYYAFAIVQPINQALFPYISGKSHLSAKEKFRYVRDAFKVYGVIVVLFVVGAFIFAKPLFSIFFDEKFNVGLEPFMPIFYLLSAWIGMVMVNYFVGLQVLVAFGKDKIYSRLYLINTIIAVSGFISLIPKIGLVAVPLSLICGELVLFLFLFSSYLKLRKEANSEVLLQG